MPILTLLAPNGEPITTMGNGRFIKSFSGVLYSMWIDSEEDVEVDMDGRFQIEDIHKLLSFAEFSIKYSKSTFPPLLYILNNIRGGVSYMEESLSICDEDFQKEMEHMYTDALEIYGWIGNSRDIARAADYYNHTSSAYMDYVDHTIKMGAMIPDGTPDRYSWHWGTVAVADMSVLRGMLSNGTLTITDLAEQFAEPRVIDAYLATIEAGYCKGEYGPHVIRSILSADHRFSLQTWSDLEPFYGYGQSVDTLTAEVFDGDNLNILFSPDYGKEQYTLFPRDYSEMPNMHITLNGRQTFIKNLKEKMKVLDGVDLTGFVVAGGSVLTSLVPNVPQSEDEDIDLFTWGDEAHGNIIRLCLDIFQMAIDNNRKVYITVSRTSVTFHGLDRKIQLIRIKSDSPKDVIITFDLPCVRIYHDFAEQKTICTPSFITAINSRINDIRHSSISNTTVHRIAKYYNKGFNVMDGSRLNGDSFFVKTGNTGLGNLILKLRRSFDADGIIDVPRMGSYMGCLGNMVIRSKTNPNSIPSSYMYSDTIEDIEKVVEEYPPEYNGYVLGEHEFNIIQVVEKWKDYLMSILDDRNFMSRRLTPMFEEQWYSDIITAIKKYQ